MPAVSTYSTGSQWFSERTSSFEWASVRQDFAFSSIRLKTACKMALAATLGMMIAFTFNWRAVSTVMVVSLFFNRPDYRFDLRQTLGSAAAAASLALFFYLSLNLSQNPVCFGLLVGGGLILYGALTTLPTFGACFSIGQVVACSVLVLYFYQPNPPPGVFFNLTVQTTLGYTLMLAVTYLIWPYSPRRELDERLHRAWRECRKACALWFAGAGGNSCVLQRPNPLDRNTVEMLRLLSKIIPMDAADKGLELRTLAASRVQEIIILLQDLRRLSLDLTAQSSPTAFTSLGAALDRQFLVLEGILQESSCGIPPMGKRSMKALVEAAAHSLPAGGATEIKEDLRHLCATLDACTDPFRTLAKLPSTERLTNRRQDLIWTPPFHWKMLLQLNAYSFKQGVKIALVVLGCLGFWQAFRWPAGGAIMISALTVTMPNVGLASRQSILRVIGLLLGLLCAYLCTALVVTNVETIFGCGLCVFCALLALGYLSGANPRVNYIGFQAAFTFVFVFASSDQQSIDLEPLRARFVALVAGVVIAEVIMQSFWPVRKVNSLFASLAGNFATCARAWSAFLSDGGKLAAIRKELVSQFNNGLMAAGQLTTIVEFEGEEGSPRYGYAGRLLAHEIALFEQLHLFGLDRADAVADGDVAIPQAERIRNLFMELARRLGHPVEPSPRPPEERSHPASEPADARASHHDVLEGRSAEIERILASIDRLTSLPSTA